AGGTILRLRSIPEMNPARTRSPGRAKTGDGLSMWDLRALNTSSNFMWREVASLVPGNGDPESRLTLPDDDHPRRPPPARRPAGRAAGPAARARGRRRARLVAAGACPPAGPSRRLRSEEHTSELQSRENLVCRLPLDKKK